jgi:hypothetical protein
MVVSVVLGAGAFVGCSDPPVDTRMHAANETVNRYCRPLTSEPIPGPPEMRRALGRIAARERDDPDGEFRVDDSAEATTAGKLLDDLASLSRSARCSDLEAEIQRVRSGGG